MKSTLKELSELFHLSSHDHKQLKLGLVNKLIFISDNNVEIIDHKLKELVWDFRQNGILDLKEACSSYKISLGVMIGLVKEEKIPFFQLTSSQGSKILFQRSELDKEHELFIRFSKKKDYVKLYGFIRNWLIGTEILFDIEISILDAFFLQNNSLEQIAHNNSITRERVRQIKEKALRKMRVGMYKTQQYKNEYFRVCEELRKSRKEYSFLKNLLIEYGIEKAKIDMEENKPNIPQILRKKVVDCDISVRALNALKAYDVETIYQLVQLTGRDFLKFRNFGKKSLKELADFLSKNNLSFEMDLSAYKNPFSDV